MRVEIKQRIKRFVKELPIVDGYFANRQLRESYKVEWELIKGKHLNDNTHKSIIHFSINKAATQYVKSILGRCAVEKGMVRARINDYAFNSKFPFLDCLSAEEMKKYQHVFKPNGYLYSVFGGMIDGICDIDKYRVVLMVRDPRDVITSCYYSFVYSHAEPGKQSNKTKAFAAVRNYAKEVDIDEFVIHESGKLAEVYQRYVKHLLRCHPNVFLARYEDMICDFGQWLERLLEYCELDISDQLTRSILDEAQTMRPKQENAEKHIRQGKSGDHKRKLKEETICKLNQTFSHVLDEFNYA